MDQTLSLKLGGILVLGVLGFVFPPAWIGAALLGLGVAGAVAPVSTRPRAGHGRVREVTPEAEDWLARFHACCESPAETAFLDAMVAEFGLKPDAGRLVGGGLTLHPQVPVLEYRLDFLVEPDLVVEVDGAAWHSSPEAAARDKARDARLAEHGYHTLRLPARLVLNTPTEAMSRVRRAWSERLAAAHQAEEARAAHIRDSFRPSRVFGALGQGLASVQKGIGEGIDYAHRNAAEFREQNRLAAERDAQKEQAKRDAEMKALMDDVDTRKKADPAWGAAYDKCIEEGWQAFVKNG